MEVASHPGPASRRRRAVVAVVLAAAGVLHVPPAVQQLSHAPWLGVLSLVLAAAAVTVAGLVLGSGAPSVVLAAALVGMLGVALGSVAGLVALGGLGAQIQPWTPWAVGAFIADAFAVRLAAFTLRFSGATGHSHPKPCRTSRAGQSAGH